MEEAGAQVTPSIFMHQTLSSRFCEPPTMAKKRHLSYQAHNFQPQNYAQQRIDDWNPNLWHWDSVGFSAKPMDSEVLSLGTPTSEPNNTENQKNNSVTVNVGNDGDGRLDLNLGGGLCAVDEPVTKPNKRFRSESPGSASAPYPMCQVDNCKESLSNAKDYHRRHKVCEVHSKSTNALVGKQMQRFCQQCSRFHPLSEFDEGKRSCRRRLAGHNRRRRKTQTEDVSSRMLIHGNKINIPTGNVDMVNLLTALARAQGKTEDRSVNCSTVPDREQLMMILSKINSLPLPAALAAKLHNFGSLNRKNPVLTSSDFQNRLNGNTSSSSTMDLLAVLSATLTAASPDALVTLSQRSCHNSDSEKTKSTCNEQATPNFLEKTTHDFPSVGGEKSSTSYQSPVEDSEGQIQDIRVNLPLQLFSSSPENDSQPKLSRKCFSSDSSNPIEERSPSSSPVMQTLFPMQSTSEKLSIGREANANVKGSQIRCSNMPLELFRGSNILVDNSSFQSFPNQAGCTSSSGSDHSPSSLNSVAQDLTGQIIFKLFEKDPSHFPGTLRKQIYNWLSNSPSEMESYIRPGCVVLSLYVSMPYAVWEQLEGNLRQQVNSLLQDSDSDFWRNARFLVHVGKQLASHKDGTIRVCKSRRSWSSPELISVSPLAVIGGQEISLKLRGRNLANLGTKIHCTFMGGYASREVTGSTCLGSLYDEINLGGFKTQDTSSSLGRFFIEVENGFQGNSFPIIIADATICKELRLLESEFDAQAKICDVIFEDQAREYGRPRSREEVLHFLNELGWLFQRKRSSAVVEGSDYSLSRFKFLLIFSANWGFCALVKAILDMLVEGNLGMDGLSGESFEMLCEIQLLNRAVKMRCRRMVDLLIHYSITSSNDTTRKYIFPPNLAGPGGITPLHLAACTSDSVDIIEALTNDPHKIGLSCWNSILDANGQSPYSYAFTRNNHSYNNLVARKLSDRRNGQVSIAVGMEIEQSGLTKEQVHGIFSQSKHVGSKSCTKCAVAAAKFNKRVRGSQGLLNRPYIHSMLAIAAVCVCVCLFLRGSPDIGLVAPFKWENLDYGPK